MKMTKFLFTTVLTLSLVQICYAQGQSNDGQKKESTTDKVMDYAKNGRGIVVTGAGFYGTHKALDFRAKNRYDRAKILQRPLDVVTFKLERGKPVPFAKRMAVSAERGFAVRTFNALLIGGIALTVYDGIKLLRSEERANKTSNLLNRQP